MRYRIDLHTHSIGSPDGGLRLEEYRTILTRGSLDYIAITDHDSIEAAIDIRTSLAELGERIIIGEEITTLSGEIIGLYLTHRVLPGLTLSDTIAEIKGQGGLVYTPHPFETTRRGVQLNDLDENAADIDIVEVHNGRALFENRSRAARQWAQSHEKAMVASSDAHGRYGWGRTHTSIESAPSRDTLMQLLREATYSHRSVGAGVLYPKLNRLRRKANVWN